MPRGGRTSVQIGDAEQTQIATLLRTLSWTVYTIGTRQSRGRACPRCGTFVAGSHGTRQTPGFSDLAAFSPPTSPRRQLLLVESKAGAGRLTPEQRAFRELVLALASPMVVDHVAGNYDAVVAWLIANRFAKPSQFPHYRLPVGAAEGVANGPTSR